MNEYTNILTQKAPKEFLLGGTPYVINSDYRMGIRYQLTMENDDPDVTNEDKFIYTLTRFYGSLPPEKFIPEAIEKMIWFMCGGEEDYLIHRSTSQTQTSSVSKKRAFDFVIDSKLIYAAFYAQYGLDLQEIELHWWKFRAMFSGLHDTHEIVKIMGYRVCDLSKLSSKSKTSYKDEMTRLQRQYALPTLQNTSPEKMQELAGSLFGGAVISDYKKQRLKELKEEAARMHGA